MKQTTKRILCLILSALMLFSMMSVFAFAENNFEENDEYYNRIINDSVIVNTEWAGLTDGDAVSYVYRGKTIKESFDSNIHFASLTEAYSYCCAMNVKSPIIIVCPGTYSEKLTISTNVTILGANAGINPNVVSDTEGTPWTANADRGAESMLRGYIDVSKKVNSDIEIVFDGVTLTKGFAYIDAGKKKAVSSAVLKNSIISGAGSTTYGVTSVSNVFYFASSSSSTNNVKIENVLCTNMRSSSIIGVGVTSLDINGLYYTNSTYPAISGGDGPVDQNPSFSIKNSMFYNNLSEIGVLSFDCSAKDSSARTESNIEIADCVFSDDLSSTGMDVSPIAFTMTSGKNKLNVHDNTFIAAEDYTSPLVDYVFTGDAITGSFTESIAVKNNKLYGYCVLNDTTGLKDTTRFDYTGNYFADADKNQIDPFYPTDASKKNIQIDYFWLDSDMTYSSANYLITSIGIANSTIDNVSNVIKVALDYGEKYTINPITSDSSVTYKVYDQGYKNEITQIDSTQLLSGEDKNIYYAVGTSTNNSYTKTYSIILTTYNPELSEEFNTPGMYMLSDGVASMAAGDLFYKAWDGMAYKFTVGKNVFSTIEEIFAVCDGIPTIMLPAGVYNKQITLTRSAVVLGAKHGINPNVPLLDTPGVAWQCNPERSQRDQETILESSTILIAPDAVNVTAVVDGVTFGAKGAFADKGEGLETYTTSIIKNVIIDGAGGAAWAYDGKSEALSTVLSFGGGSETYAKNHKDVRLVNLRMANQGATRMLGDYFETLIMVGVYVAYNTTTLHSNEWTHPKGQNFYLEIRNSCFFKNTTSTYYFLVNNNSNDSDATTSNRVVLDNNIFFNTSSNPNGIFGIRYCGNKDSIRFVNNTFITTSASSVTPGNAGWFLGKSGTNNGIDLDKVEIVSDAYIRHNRFIGCISQIDMTTCKVGTQWDYSFNYFSPAFDRYRYGQSLNIRSGQSNFAKCSSYYVDFDLTTLNKEVDDSYLQELAYSINGSGILNESAKTYTDTVSGDTKTYDFCITLETPQAKYGIYSDPECSIKLAEPVNVAGGENVYYIKLSSYDNSKTDIYKATLNKSLGTESNIEMFGSWRVTDNSIYTCVPTGVTTFEIPEIIVSDGASYEMFNDKACTSAFTSGRITGIGMLPVVKYIKVSSEDGTNSKVYMFSVIQGVNDQAELTFIENAKKVSATEFEAVIAADDSSFELIPHFSDNATITVYDNGLELMPTIGGTYLVDSIGASRQVTIKIVSGSSTSKTFSLTIKKDVMSCDVDSIFGMTENTNTYNAFETRTNGITFKVIPYLKSTSSTYAVYSDKACTQVIDEDVIVLTSAENTAYLKVTSADGSKSKVYTLDIYSSATGFTPVDPTTPPAGSSVYSVENGRLISDGVYYAKAADGIDSYDLRLAVTSSEYNTTSFKVSPDAACTLTIGVEKTAVDSVSINLISKLTTVYVRVWVRNGDTFVQEDKIKVIIDSNRPTVSYNDESSISSWAANQIKYLNENGFGYFTGDNGNFKPTDGISRFEVAVIAIRVLGIDPTVYSGNILPFNDYIPDWASNYVKACYKLNIMNGQEINLFNGAKMTSRQEFAKIIMGVLCSVGGGSSDINAEYNASKAEIDTAYEAFGFADESSISEWAKPAIRLAVASGLISGSSADGKLYINPLNVITRQEVAVILANYCGYSAE